MVKAVELCAREAVGLTIAAARCARAGTLPLAVLALSQRRAQAAEAKLPGARSAVIAAFPYFNGFDARPMSLYSRGLDYYAVMGGLLERAAAALARRWPQEGFVVLPNGAPLPVVRAARLAGVGVTGQNGLAIVRPYGSFVFLGAVLTTLRLPPVVPSAGFCAGCGQCRRACPTAALTPDEQEGGRVDRDRCISSLSQSQRLTDAQAAMLAAHPTLWGCDRCQTVCPENASPKRTELAAFCQNTLAFPVTAQDIEGRACGKRGLEVLARNAELGGLQNEINGGEQHD